MSVIFEKRDLEPHERKEVDALYEKGAWLWDKPGPPITREEKKKINHETMKQVLAFGDKLIDGTAVADRLKFDSSSLWYYHKFRAYFRFRNLKYEAHALREYANNSNENIYYFTDDRLLGGMEFPENVSIYGPARKNKSRRNYFSLFYYFTILLIRGILNLFSGRKFSKPEHIILDVTKRQTFLDMNTLKVKKGNYVLGYMIEQASKDFLILDEAIQPKVTDGAKIKLSKDHLFGKGKRKDRYFGEPVLLKYFASSALRKRRKELENKLNSELQLIANACTGEEKALPEIYQSFQGATRFYLIKYLAYKKFFSKHKYKTISSVDENSPAIRCILDAARINGIHTIGIQHGSIHDLHPAYVYTPYDKSRNAFPDHTLVWGEFWKELLVKNGHYRPEQLTVSGQIRTDIIPVLLARPFEKQYVVPELKSHEKLIVFASQPQRDPGLRKRAALDIMQAVKAMPDAFLLVKLHPNERYDTAYYKDIAGKAGLERIHITLDPDLYLLISVCDVLVTCFSTVGAETIYFKKPLVILDHLRQDIQGYHREGVALRACNKDELKDHLTDLLSGKTGIDQTAYESFIARYAFAIDGKASERALDVIEQLND